MKKYTLIIFALLLAVGFLTWRACLIKNPPLSQNDRLHSDSVRTSKSAKQKMLQNEAPPASNPWTKEGMERASGILDQLKELEGSGLPLDIREAGMIPVNKAIEPARERVSFRNYDRNQTPAVLLIDGCYVVRFFNFPDPFRAGENAVNSSVVIDAWTGEVLGTRVSTDRTYIHGLDPKSQEGISEEEKAENFERIKIAGHKLNIRVQNGQPLLAEPKDEMLSVEIVANIAKQHAKFRDRDFDPNREAMVTLIDDVYIVVLWRHPDLIAERGPTYDARVFVGAFTGKIIGMEITQYPKNNPAE